MDKRRKDLLKISLLKLTLTDNLGDPKCKTCKGHGCVDAGNMFGCIMEHCPDCYTNKKRKKKKKLTKKEIKLLNKPGTHTNYFATDL